ncbi:hypothetical protein E2562_036738 [Oryza meyeriana var. granulata]|uniref:Uncharacterized protein n=1 Tax=Oryza meyeriana var. granulata TaxID=110450 RepID=A0A6G1DTM2_9ORYZ|nr:hypothetical protein E2562_036738 [Oryza meyeriana var. granulata]
MARSLQWSSLELAGSGHELAGLGIKLTGSMAMGSSNDLSGSLPWRRGVTMNSATGSGDDHGQVSPRRR